MALIIRSIEHSDVAQCIALRVASLGSLAIGRPPPYPGYVQKAEASVHNDLNNRPFVHHLKIIDPENEGDIMAYGKWEVYPEGRRDLDKLAQPIDLAEMEVDQYGLLRAAAHEYFCTRNVRQGQHPHLLLALLVTDSRHRRKGAGSLVVQWGVDMSEATELPCYLQASEQGRRLYGHHGFQAIDTVEFDLSQYGLKGAEKMTEMRRVPRSKIA